MNLGKFWENIGITEFIGTWQPAIYNVSLPQSGDTTVVVGFPGVRIVLPVTYQIS